MKRRSAIGIIGSAITAGLAGCLNLDLGDDLQRLMFIRIHNASDESVVDIRVIRDGDKAFEDRFEIPAFEGADSADEHEAKFHDRPHIILIEDEWDTSPAPIKVEYRLADGKWKHQQFSDSDNEIVGLTVQVLGFTAPGINSRIHEFESTDQVELLLQD